VFWLLPSVKPGAGICYIIWLCGVRPVNSVTNTHFGILCRYPLVFMNWPPDNKLHFSFSLADVMREWLVSGKKMSVLKILILITLAALFLLMAVFVCSCCYRTYRNLRRTEDYEPLLGEEDSERAASLSLNYNDTLSRSTRVYQPTPFTLAGRAQRTESKPPAYEDLFGSVSQPYPSWMQDNG